MKKSNLIITAILVVLFLSPSNARAQTVVSQNSSVQVSNIYQGSKPESLVDGNLSLGWNSGAFAPQWAILDLHSPKSISQLRLMSGQSPDGQVLFKITLSSEDHSTVFELTLDRYVKAGQWINIPMLSSIANVRYIKLETIKSPSWIAWQELEATDTPSAGSQHLRYFGYYGLVSGGVPLVYHFTEISNLANSNVGIIPSHTAQKMREMLTLAKSAGLKVFIAPRNITYNDSTLNPNYQQILTGLHSLFEEFDSVILGFYFDEMIGSGTDIADFTKITSYLRSKYPSKKILAIESDTPISVMSIPPSYFTNLTDVGFDYYSSVWTASNEVGLKCQKELLQLVV